MFNWLKKLLLSKYIKGVLDKLPLNGKKTYLGLVLLIVGIVIEAIGKGTPTGQILLVVYDVLRNIEGINIITDPAVIAIISGTVSTVLGLFHKLLKKVDAK